MIREASRESTDARRAAAAITAVAIATGAIVPRLPRRLRLPSNVVVATASVAIARRAGTSWRGLGLHPRSARRGATAGLLVLVPVATAVAVTLAVPRLRLMLDDARITTATNERAAYELLVRIPVETALAEEVLFRSALLGVATGAWRTPTAVAISSTAFGAWHVVPALEAHASNAVGADLVRGRGGRATHVVGTVGATALAGAALSTLRLRSGSVVAPILAHASINAAGYLAARGAHTPRRRGQS
jgi:membrane protease YdiL (CAAX protease family)